LGVLVAGAAFADPYDLRIYRLGNPMQNGTGFTPAANANFRVFARQLGAAMSSVTLMPPETLGHAGFAFSAEIAIVDIKQDASGVEGIAFPTNQAISGPVLIPSFHVRKGLPYSFELDGRLGWFEKSRMFIGSLGLKWAINEGFTYLPDISVGGRISKLLNSRDFDVTTGGLEIMIGKQFALGGMVTLTPYVGWNLSFVGASSNPIDFNPQRNLAQAELPSDQFTDIYVYNSVQASANTHNRFFGGLRFIGHPFMLGAEVSYTLISAFHDEDSNTDRKVPAVLSGNFMVGVDL
jgi:hypothetical protein